jgi:hypothetical protein
MYNGDINQSELGKAVRVFHEAGHVFKLAQHLESGRWGIWMTYTQADDWDAFNENFDALRAQGLSFEDAAKQAEMPKLAEPLELAMLVDDDISPEYARENEGIFEHRCYNVLAEMRSLA